jgi:hypothetical protein
LLSRMRRGHPPSNACRKASKASSLNNTNVTARTPGA